MKKLLKLILLFVAIFFTAPSLFAQLDTKHYIPPMFGREDEGTHYIVLSTPSTTPFNVTITDGSGTLITTQTISNVSSSSYLLGSGTATQFLVQESELNTIMANEGLILTGNSPFYVNIRVVAGAQAGSLTSKGEKASLGQDFRTGHLFNNDGDDYRKANVFGIMATEDNTTINIDGISAGVIFKNTPQTGGTSDNITVVLDEGESYVVAAYLDEPGATNNTNGVNGTHITSDKDIVVNSGSWLGGNAIVGGSPAAGRDLGIDQIVPIELVGDEYVVIKGEGIDNEKVIVIATANNTDIFLNGSGTPTTTLMAGDYYAYVDSDFTGNDNMYIESSKPVYVYQTENSGDGTTDDNERQCGLNFLPPVGCSGSKNVQLPDVDFLGTAQINIIANAGSSVVVDGVPLGAGDAVTGTGDYVTYKLANAYTGDITITADDLLRVSLINLSGNVGAAGYFSGFTKDVAVQTNTINADNIALEGCIPASFTFAIDGVSNDPTVITYQIGGSATNGVDYDYIDTLLTIPAGQTEGTVFINTIADALPEGQETVYIIYQPDLCSPVDTAELFIDDAQPIEFTLDGTDLGCNDNNSGEILVNASGGFPAYTYYVTDDSGNGNTVQYTSNPITNLPADTYSVQVYDIYGCKAEALLIGGIFDADTTFLPDGTGVSYEADLNISGFQPGQTLDDMSQLQSICATMEHSYLGDLQIKIIAPSGEEVILKQFNGGGSCDLGEPFASGPVDGQNSNLTDPGVGYEYCFNDSPNYGTMVAESNNYTHTIPASTGGTYTDTYLPSGAYESFENLDGLLGATLNGTWTLEVSDQFGLDNGYIFNWNISLQSDLPDTLVTLEEPNEIAISGFVTQANCGGSDGSIDISVSGDYPPFTFNWSNGPTSEDNLNIPAGTYMVWVTDANGCTDSMEFILNNISSMNITTNVTPVTCAGGTDGAIDIVTSGGTPPYSWSWSNGATTEDISSLTDGTYTLTITDDNGCVFSEEIEVGALPGINISVNSITNDVCSQETGAIDLTVTGGTGSYGYSWDNGATSQDISGLGVGTYYLTVTDGNGCTTQDDFTIINDVSNCSAFCFTNIVTESLVNEVCGDGTGAIDITVMDATMPYNISWSNGPTTDDQSGLSAGTYTATILDANQCELVQEFEIGNDLGSLTISDDAVSNENCGSGDGSIDITVTGGTAPYSYAWSNGAATEDISSLASGSYDVTVTDDAGCEFVQSYAVGNNTGTLSESALVSSETCGNAGGSINLTVSGGTAPYSYSWSNGATIQDLSGLSAGTYDVVITDGVGCTLQSDEYTVTNDPGDLTILSTNITNENCGDGAGEIDINVINGSTPYTFSWSNGATTEDLSGISAGTYSCMITDDAGCSVSTGNLNVFNQSGTLSVTTNTLTDEVCGDGAGAIDIDVSGGTTPYTFSWSNGSTTEDISGLSAGTYSLTVTDAGGCSETYNEIVNNASDGFDLVVTNVTDENCGDGSGAIDITATGGAAPITYSWSNGASTEDINSLNAGVYMVTATDNNGCEVSTSATVNGDDIEITSSVISDEICGNGSGAIDITFNGGLNPYNFAWDNGSISEDISGLSAGTYNLTITGTNGCTTSESFVVGNNTNGLAITSTVVTDENCGDGAGAINVTVNGGANPLDFDWDNGASTEDLNGLSAGTYNLILTDANGCSVNTSGTVINNSAGFTASINTIADENCGDGTGAIDVDVIGGAAPYSFSWDNGATTEDQTGLSAGTYSLTVTDDNGCEVVVNGTVNNNTGTLAISNEVIGNASCSSPNGFIDLSMTGGATPYSFNWSNGATTEDISGVSPGTYTCVITDNAGCTINYSGEVVSTSGGITASDVIVNELCGNGEGSITVTVNGGSAPYSFTWTGSSPNSCCEYTLDMQDTGNSWNGASIDVEVNGVNVGNFTVPGGGSNIETFTACSGDNIEIFWNTGGFDNEVFFSLLDPDMNAIYSHAAGTAPTPGSLFSTTANCPGTGPNVTSIENLSEGIYDLTITDNAGCEVNESYTVVNQSSNIQINVGTITNETCDNNNGEIVYSVNGGSGNWSATANGFNDGAPVGVLSNLFADDWEIIATDDDTGCTDTTVVTIFNAPTFSVNTVITNENCDDNAGEIDQTITGGVGPFSFAWNTGDNTEDLTVLDEGTYSVQITDDGDGCQFDTTYTIENDVDLTLSAVVTEESCGDGTGAIDLTVTVSSDLTISWDNGATTEDLSGLTAGIYTVSVLNNITGCLAVESYEVTNNTSGMTVSANITDENCSDGAGAIDITITGGVGPFDYSWSNGETTEDISGLTYGNYTLTVTDQFDGCSDEFTYTVESGGSFNLDLISVTNESCGDGNGEIDIDVSGPQTFNAAVVWSHGPTTEDVTGLSAGTYTVDVTNGAGCTMSMDVEIENDSDITLFSSITDETCLAGDGAIDLTVSGGSGLTYLWSNGATTEDITGLSNGLYDVTVTSTSGCSESMSFSISNETTGMEFSEGSVIAELCDGADGWIDITVNGGVGPYSFNWSSGQTTEDLSGLTDGSYTVTVTDDNDGCMMDTTFVVADSISDLEISDMLVVNEECDNVDGEIDATITGGTGPLTYAWSNGETTEDITGLDSGWYILTVEDGATGCMVVDSAEVMDVTSGVEITAITVTPETCTNGDGAIDITVGGGVGPYSYSWSNGETTEDISGLSAGPYSVTVTDDNDGCQIVLDTIVTSTQNFTVSGVIDNASCTTCPTGSIDASVNETVSDGPYTFLWSPNGETTEDISGLVPGTYTLTVTGVSGCTYDTTFVVGNDDDAGVNSEDLNWALKLYPNPTDGKVSIMVNGFEVNSITITNAQGKKLKTINVNNDEFEVDLSRFPTGVYFMHFESEERTIIKKVVRK